jgi:hypothetical protein
MHFIDLDIKSLSSHPQPCLFFAHFWLLAVRLRIFLLLVVESEPKAGVEITLPQRQAWSTVEKSDNYRVFNASSLVFFCFAGAFFGGHAATGADAIFDWAATSIARRTSTCLTHFFTP